MGISSCIELIIVFKKAQNHMRLLAFFFILFGLALVAETGLLIYFRAYEYFPMVITWNPFNDSLLGNLFSQVSISATGLLIAFFDLGFIWSPVIAGIYCLIEAAFVALGVYKHYWYRTWITFAAFPLFFWLCKKIYKKFNCSFGKVFRYTCMLLGIYAIYTVIFNWSFFIATEITIFSKSFLPDPNMSWVTLTLIYHTALFNLNLLAYYLKSKWLWKGVIFLFIYTAYYLSYKFNILYVKEGWFAFYTITSIAFNYMCVVFLARYIRQEKLY